MEEGQTLQEALEQPWDARYNFNTREHGAKKLLLKELKQDLLSFHPVGESDRPHLVGAEAAVRALTTRSPRRVIVEALRVMSPYGGPIVDAEDAVNTTQIFDEITASTAYYQQFLGDGEALPANASEVTKIVATLLEQASGGVGNGSVVDYVVDSCSRSKRKKFYLNETVYDSLVFEDIESQVPLLLQRQPSVVDGVVDQAITEDDETMGARLQLDAIEEPIDDYEQALQRALANSRTHTHGPNAPASSGAGPSGVIVLD